MPITLAKLKKKTAQVEVTYQGEKAVIVYRPNAVTPALWRRATASGNNQEFLTTSIAEVVEDWDVVAAEGGPKIGPNSEEASNLPTDFLDLVMNAIFDDIRAGTDAKKA